MASDASNDSDGVVGMGEPNIIEENKVALDLREDSEMKLSDNGGYDNNDRDPTATRTSSSSSLSGTAVVGAAHSMASRMTTSNPNPYESFSHPESAAPFSGAPSVAAANAMGSHRPTILRERSRSWGSHAYGHPGVSVAAAAAAAAASNAPFPLAGHSGQLSPLPSALSRIPPPSSARLSASPVTSPLPQPYAIGGLYSRPAGSSSSTPVPPPPTPGSYAPYTAPPLLPNLNPTSSPPSNAAAVTSVGASGLPFLPPPSPSHLQRRSRAVEAAVEAERARAKDLEQEEKAMDADALRASLRRERNRSAKLVGDLAALWSAAVESQAEAEVHEESRINWLMRRLDRLQREKGRIIVELEREEEMLTNNLQKKLNEVRREKAQLERQIEQEQALHSDAQEKLNQSSIATKQMKSELTSPGVPLGDDSGGAAFGESSSVHPNNDPLQGMQPGRTNEQVTHGNIVEDDEAHHTSDMDC